MLVPLTPKLWVILMSMLLLLPTVRLYGETKGVSSQEQPAELVWPPPPMEPRIRYLRSIRTSEDVTGKVKLSFMERLLGRSPERAQTSLVKPFGVAVGPDGRVYVADLGQRSVLVFDLNQNKIEAWRGTGQFPLDLPAALAFDESGRLFVTDAGGHRVVVFDHLGKPILSFGFQELKRPAGIAINSASGKIYIADAAANEILIFSLESLDLIKKFGGPSSPDSEPGRFLGVTSIALDREGRLYVADTFNRRIQVFDQGGEFLHVFGSVGIQPGNFVRPKGIALDSEGHIYVVDAEFNNLQILDSTGQPLMFVGAYGGGPGEFTLPTGVAIDGSDRIYVVEQGFGAGRMQIFQYLPVPQRARP